MNIFSNLESCLVTADYQVWICNEPMYIFTTIGLIIILIIIYIYFCLELCVGKNGNRKRI